MNGEEKEEAPRPRPLSGGIWTLFSWLRRSERSSSSESLSSVGSARTAASFDFLSPGHCNFANTPIVLTTQLGAPTETYKKRLQDRNLRRQRDRDITLHRKYGLFREYGNGYDGFSLPPARRALGNTVNRQNRERRATSECLQRRAAYVPGKRRAPLPPVLLTSASLPRSYKRKRPAPKPPVQNTIKEVNQENNHLDGMNSNVRVDGVVAAESELFMCTKTKKCDKKGTSSKDTKSKSDKSFLKHIFENKKRSSAIETTSVRLLPSISELDKQAAEIIENNKLQQNKNNFDKSNNGTDSASRYEGNSWFCTSCLRKYSSSVNSCNYCLPEERRTNEIVEKYSIKTTSPRVSIYTQTNNNLGNTSSQSCMDERELLKEILKEMKDSLPKKHKDNNTKVNVNTETPTLRIGSTVPEAYKVSASDPSSSREITTKIKAKENIVSTETPQPSKIFSISSLLSETRRNEDPLEKYYRNNKQRTTGEKSEHAMRNVIQHKITLVSENHENAPSTSKNTPEEKISLPTEDITKKKIVSDDHLQSCRDIGNATTDKVLSSTSSSVNKIDVKANSIIPLKSINNTKNDNNNQRSVLSSVLPKTSEVNELNNNLLLSNKTSRYSEDRRKHFFGDHTDNKTASNRQIQALTTSVKTNEETESEKVKPTPCKASSIEHFQKVPVTNSVVVNSVTVVTLQSNEILSEAEKKLPTKNIQNQSTRSTNSTEVIKTVDKQSDINTKKVHEKSNISVKPESNLHIPLKISSLLNYTPAPTTAYTPKLPIINESSCTKTDNIQLHESGPQTNKSINITTDKTESKQIKIAVQNSESVAIPRSKKIIETPHEKEVQLEIPNVKEAPETDFKNLPSTSGCCSKSTVNTNNNIDKLDHYDRRRHLINQLEQSIARGDEAAAADAAVKLAKLRLSCSVLSFSSQIVGESSTPNTSEENKSVNKVPHTALHVEKEIRHNTPESYTTGVRNEDEKDTKNIVVNNVTTDKSDTKLDLNNQSLQKPSSEPSSSTNFIADNLVPINVWVEDKQAARGPIRLRISRRATMADLRAQAERSLGLASQLQRWIVGHTLCNDDSATVVSLAGPNFTGPFYLCLVQSETSSTAVKESAKNDAADNIDTKENQNGDFYTELMKLEKQSLVPNLEPFECGVCMEECAAGAGVVLRECIHTFCRECLADVVQHSQDPAVSCPAVGCSGFLQEREIRTIVTPEEHERWLARSLATAESGTRNTFHCRTRDCTGWAFCDPGVRRFPCPVCKHTNCVQCQALHEGETCERYQAKLREAVAAAETNKGDEGTQALLTSLISRGEALECPECKAIITKKWGCDWVKCSACKTEICWITKGRRWGPGGRGDTSGGCRCGVDGQRCHPSCGYCH